MKVSAESARRFLVARQLLAPARSLQGGRDAVLEVFRRFGSIQYDPIDVAGRTHDLMLHARVADYDPAWCDELYERREIFEAFNKGLSFVYTPEFPWFRAPLRGSLPPVIDENPEVGARVLDRIKAEGPLSSLDFESERGSTTDWFGIPTNTVRALLEAYTLTGVLGLARRDGKRRYYDLLERLLPKKLVRQDRPAATNSCATSSTRATARTASSAWAETSSAASAPRSPTRGGRRIRAEPRCARSSSRAATSFRFRSRACGKRFVLREEVGLLEAPPEPPASVAFLPPFDPLVWDRALLGSLFGFDYVWELFHPPAKRRWGWYVLPILFGDRFVGRIEPRIDRAGGRVEVIGLWWEDGFEPKRAEGFVDAMREAVRAYLRFAGARRIEWAPHLAKERRLLT